MLERSLHKVLLCSRRDKPGIDMSGSQVLTSSEKFDYLFAHILFINTV